MGKNEEEETGEELDFLAPPTHQNSAGMDRPQGFHYQTHWTFVLMLGLPAVDAAYQPPSGDLW